MNTESVYRLLRRIAYSLRMHFFNFNVSMKLVCKYHDTALYLW